MELSEYTTNLRTIVDNIEPLEKLRIYCFYYINSYYLKHQYKFPIQTFSEFISPANITAYDNGPHWKENRCARRVSEQISGIYDYY
jgi:hypothetical protein